MSSIKFRSATLVFHLKFFNCFPLPSGQNPHSSVELQGLSSVAAINIQDTNSDVQKCNFLYFTYSVWFSGSGTPCQTAWSRHLPGCSVQIIRFWCCCFLPNSDLKYNNNQDVSYMSPLTTSFSGVAWGRRVGGTEGASCEFTCEWFQAGFSRDGCHSHLESLKLMVKYLNSCWKPFNPWTAGQCLWQVPESVSLH